MVTQERNVWIALLDSIQPQSLSDSGQTEDAAKKHLRPAIKSGGQHLF